MSKFQRIPDVLVDRLEQEKEVSTMDKKILMKQKSVTAFERKEGQTGECYEKLQKIFFDGSICM